MLRISKKLTVGLVIAFMIMTILGSITVFTADIGTQLNSPQPGWRRYNDRDPNIIYSGNFYEGVREGSDTYVNLHGIGSAAHFKFVGSKLRLVSEASNLWVSDNAIIIIDGVLHRFNQTRSSPQANTLVFEIDGLEFKEHSVTITIDELTTDRNHDGVKTVTIEEIDIDATGYLVESKPTNLQVTAGDSSINVSWDEGQGVTSYNVKRATMAGGPYTTIAQNVSGTTYTDTDVINGTTYYYVVSALYDTTESNNSLEESATLEEPASTKALLKIIMINGSEKEYDLSMENVNAFITWYNNRANGTGNEAYEIDKSYNLGPFLSRKDYIIFDKVLTFEVMEYAIH